MAITIKSDVPLSKRIGGIIERAEDAGIITDAIVAANATVTALNAALLAPIPAEAPLRSKVKQALLKAVDAGLVAETHTFTTISSLVSATDATTGVRAPFMT